MRDSLLTREIEKLKEKLLALGGHVEKALALAIESVERRDVETAQTVIDGDAFLDRMEVDVEEECLKLLALHQPVAVDLRFIVTVLKVNNDLERIGDHAASLAKHAVLLANQPLVEPVFDFSSMAEKAQGMLKRSLDALVYQRADQAMAVRAEDDEIDAINRNMYRAVEREIMRRPENTPVYVTHVGLSRCLERIADLATNIAEDVIYLTTGQISRHG